MRARESPILLRNYHLPGDLKRAVADLVGRYSHRRKHESLDKLTPAGVYIGQRSRNRQPPDEIKTCYRLSRLLLAIEVWAFDTVVG